MTQKTSGNRSEEALKVACDDIRITLKVGEDAIITDRQWRSVLVSLNRLASECVANGMMIGQEQMTEAITKNLKGLVTK